MTINVGDAMRPSAGLKLKAKVGKKRAVKERECRGETDRRGRNADFYCGFIVLPLLQVSPLHILEMLKYAFHSIYRKRKSSFMSLLILKIAYAKYIKTIISHVLRQYQMHDILRISYTSCILHNKEKKFS